MEWRVLMCEFNIFRLPYLFIVLYLLFPFSLVSSTQKFTLEDFFFFTFLNESTLLLPDDFLSWLLYLLFYYLYDIWINRLLINFETFPLNCLDLLGAFIGAIVEKYAQGRRERNYRRLPLPLFGAQDLYQRAIELTAA